MSSYAEFTNEPKSSAKIKIKGDDLRNVNVYAYGVGHVLNDITASCWFNFLPYFLTEIILLHENKAGFVILSGQVADALATPFVGIMSDKTDTRCGKRTPWYVGGTILVVICFSLIFQPCFICNKDHTYSTMELMYYLVLPSLFNIGWASVQVAHMSLLPQISANKKNKDRMVRIRTGFTFISQFLSLMISLIVFLNIKDKVVQYQYLSLLCVILGIITTIVFLFNCKEVILSKNIDKYVEEMRTALFNLSSSNEDSIKANTYKENIPQGNENETEKIDWKYWMKKKDFYAYMIVYMFVRLSINVTGSMIPYYLQNVLNFRQGNEGQTPVEISIVLIISMLGSVFNSIILQEYVLKGKNRLLMIIYSSLFVFAGCLPILFINEDSRYFIYILSFIYGVGFSLALSTASSLCNDVVSSKGKYGAFVYGAYSFSDKMSCGIVLMFFLRCVKNNNELLKYMTALMAPISMMLALLMVFFMKKILNNKESENENLKEKGNSSNKNEVSMSDDSRLTFLSLK